MHLTLPWIQWSMESPRTWRVSCLAVFCYAGTADFSQLMFICSHSCVWVYGIWCYACRKVSDQLLKYSGAFLVWDYGGALIFDGIHQVSRIFGLSNYTVALNHCLDNFLADPSQYGYKILHKRHIDFGTAVGDTIGLFPIAYLNRVIAQSGKPGYDNTTDMYIVRVTAHRYIQGWPSRLPDATFSRDRGWAGEPSHGNSFLWADDQYMGVTLLSRLGAALQDPLLVTDAARQVLQFAKRLQDPSDSLYYHGYNNADQHRSCCKWGRGNGWGVLGNLEALEALAAFPQLKHSPMYQELLWRFENRMEALLQWQSTDGRWHQVINETSTFLETSCTAMFLVSMVRGVQGGWLSRRKFQEAIEKAWLGLQKTVEKDGTVDGVVMGTGGLQICCYDFVLLRSWPETKIWYIKTRAALKCFVGAVLYYQTLCIKSTKHYCKSSFLKPYVVNFVVLSV